MEMPPKCKGFVIRMFDDGEDYDTIVINPCYNWEQQQETYRHELKHIEYKDLEGECDPDVIERLRHA
jgi:hypothetical protein